MEIYNQQRIDWEKYLGSLLLIILGLWYIYEAYFWNNIYGTILSFIGIVSIVLGFAPFALVFVENRFERVDRRW